MARVASRLDDFGRAQAMRAESLPGRFDPWIAIAGLMLLAFGTVMVASASFPEAVDSHLSPFHFLIRHVVFLAAGLLLAGIAMRTELKTLEQHSRWLPALCVLLLVLVAVPGLGVTVKGARRWINLGFMRVQPVEMVKLMMIVWLASYMVRFRDEVSGTWKAMLKALLVACALGAVLLVVQKDFGSTALLLAITTTMLLLGGVNIPRMAVPVVLLLPVLALMILLEPYRMKRLVSYLDPWQDPLGSGYQLTNALMAIGRGEFWGVGLGGSVQKLAYLPEAHTDFIMAVISEELGFVGVCAVIGMYALLVGRTLYLGLKCVEMRRWFAGFCAMGIGLWIAFQAFISIGVNLGLLPTKGLTLPFISSGGSSLLATCVALGLVMRISYELDRAQRQVAVRRAAMPTPPATGAPQSTKASPGNTLQGDVDSVAGDRASAIGQSIARLLRREVSAQRETVDAP